MKILMSPSVRELNKNQIEYSLDKKWLSFLYEVFGDFELLLPEKYSLALELIILCGGNDLLKINSNKVNRIRYKQDKKLYDFALKNNIPLIGICYGAQFLAEKLNCKLEKIKNHVGNHLVSIHNHESFLIKKNKNFKVNSFHNIGIIGKTEKITILATAEDKSIELFRVNKIFLGMMWHPERFNKTRAVDKDIFLTFYRQK